MMRAPWLVSACALALILFIGFAPSYHIGLMAFAGIDTMAGLGLVLLMRAGQVSLGHAAFVGIGAYSAALLAGDGGISPWLALPAGGIVAAMAAVPVGLLTLRLRGTYLPLATLALGISVYVCIMASDFTGGSSGMRGIPELSIAGSGLGPRGVTGLIWALAFLATLSCSWLLRSRIGRAARTFEDHEAAAVSFGVDVPAVKMKIFLLSATLAGVAGALYAFQTHFLSPTPFGINASFRLLIMVIIGGATHPVGAVIGALLVSGIDYTLQTLFSSLIDRIGPIEPVLFGILLVVLLLRWPGGLWTIVAPYLARDAIKPHVAVPQTTRRIETSIDPLVEAGTPPALELINVNICFGGVQALRDLSLKVPAGQIVGLIGPNGAGKSTAFNVMSGLTAPTVGEVCLRGEALPDFAERVVAHGIARTFQHVKLVGDMTVIENVALGAFWRGRAGILAGMCRLDRIEEEKVSALAAAALDRVGLLSHASDATGSLPLGKQRLVEIARALAAGPTVLLLDEPAAGLRAIEKEALITLVRRLHDEGVSVVLVEHDMRLVMTCVDYLIVLDRGALLAEGKPAFVRADPAVKAAYLGTRG